jgi:hypothetical protein
MRPDSRSKRYPAVRAAVPMAKRYGPRDDVGAARVRGVQGLPHGAHCRNNSDDGAGGVVGAGGRYRVLPGRARCSSTAEHGAAFRTPRLRHSGSSAASAFANSPCTEPMGRRGTSGSAQSSQRTQSTCSQPRASLNASPVLLPVLPPVLPPLATGRTRTSHDYPGRHPPLEQGERYAAGRRGRLQDAFEGTVKAEIAGSKPVGRASRWGPGHAAPRPRPGGSAGK